MTLGTFQPRQRISGDKLPLNNYMGRPLLVRTNEYVEAFTSQKYPNPKPVVFCDVVDLISGQIFINVLWGGGAVVDNLKEFAGTEQIMPVKPGQAVGGSGRTYQTLLALEGQESAAAQQWYSQYWPLVDQERAKRETASRPLQQSTVAQQYANQTQPGLPGSGYAAPQGQPAAAPQQYQQPAPQGLPHDQGQFGQPAPQQYPAAQPGYGAPQGQPGANLPAPAYAPGPQTVPAQSYQNPAPQGVAPGAAQYAQAQGQPAFGGPVPGFQGQPDQSGQFAAPAPAQQAAPQGMFTDAMPPAQPGQGFAPPPQQDPNQAQAMLNQLNGQLGG